MKYIETREEDIFVSQASKTDKDGELSNDEMNLAWQYVANTNVSLFLTGKAGTGKTTFLRKLREMCPKRMVVLAPTGVAAINAQGQTIHSFFQLPFGPMVPGVQGERKSYYRTSKEKKNLIRTLDLLVIDEISMVRCDLLDAIDGELRKYKDRTKPFGGVQLLLIGDLQQLAPVAKESEWQLLSPYYSTPYFFGSKALNEVQYVTIELQHIYRQQDKSFINILAKIRSGCVDSATVEALNSRYIPAFEPDDGQDWIRLTTHNNTAREYNEHRLDSLPSQPIRYRAEIHGNFPETSYPADVELVVKIGAQVMFIKNDPTMDKAYYNGKIGIVRGEDEEGVAVYCKEDDRLIIVPKVEWENTKYVIDDKTKEIKEEVEGTFKQYPLRLAWAITVHKSQGLTFDHAVIDINDSFAHGQAYVAMSRCRTLEGMVLSRPLAVSSIITDASVNSYINKEIEDGKNAKAKLPEMKYQYFLALLDDLFNFKTLRQDLGYLTRVVDEHLYGSHPNFLSLLKETQPKIETEIVSVAMRFQNQYVALMRQSQNFAHDPKIQERIKAASQYFYEKITTLLDPVDVSSKLQIGNKTVRTQYNNALESFILSYKLKKGIFSKLLSQDFNVTNYLRAKALSMLDDTNLQPTQDIEKNLYRRANVSKQEKKKRTSASQQEKKRVKLDTRAETLRMYHEGMSIKQIAEARSLTIGTIDNHLATFVTSGELDINDIVTSQRQKTIRSVVGSMDSGYTLSDIKESLPDDYSYAEIKLVIADIKREGEEC